MAKKSALSKGQVNTATNDVPASKPKPASEEPTRVKPAAANPAAAPLAASPAPQPSPPVEHLAPPEGPVIVGIGASAGGLAAVSELLHHLRADTGMSFVVVQHLDPHYESAMAELLARETTLPVNELPVDGLHGGTIPQPNHVYLIAPNHSLLYQDGKLLLGPRSQERGYHLPIDAFFRSLAAGQKSRAIGVVLSGSGSDGMVGLQAIKAEGGITFAQDESAAHWGMPTSAIQSGCVDFVLSPARIAEELARLGRHKYLNRVAVEPAVGTNQENGFQNIVRYLKKACGIDFEHYKRPTLQRRVERRMMLRQAGSLTDYLKLLREDRGEVDSLCQDIFIHVTSFFRDPETLHALRQTAFPRLLHNRPADAPVRVWVPGCSTGEEAFSLAILLLEFLDERRFHVPVKVFATDISEAAVAKARNGVYLESMLAEVSSERRDRYFVKCEGGYQINKPVRDLCVFAKHDVTKDPPFSQLDLISCRNVLIYLDTVLQQQALTVLHYGLKPTGFLLLGNAETTTAFGDLFDTVDSHHRIYSPRPTSRRHHADVTWTRGFPTDGRPAEADLPKHLRVLGDVQRETDRLLLSKYVPPGVVVDELFQVVQFRGQTGRYLQPPPGPPNYEILKMAREGLLAELRKALEEAKKSGEAVRKNGLNVKTNEHFSTVNLEIVPMAAPPNGQRHFVVLFEEPREARQAAPARPKRNRKKAGREDPRVLELERELADTKHYMQSIVESYEASNEELKAANEEIVSSNEELQSTYEELETAKEEVQAANEELTTVNDELLSRVATANQLNDDLANLIEGVNIPIVILDRDLKLRRFTPAAQRLLNLIPGDLGRPIAHIRPRIDIPDWVPLLQEVQETLAVQQRELRDEQGRWYSMVVRPYQTADKKIGGTVMTLLDIDAVKRSELKIVAARDFADSIVETVPTPVLVLDSEFCVRTANRSFCQTYRVEAGDLRGQSIFSVGGGAWNFPQLRELLRQVRQSDARFDNIEVRLDIPRLGRRTLLLSGRSMAGQGDGRPEFVLLAIDDITDRRRGEAMQEVQHKSIRVLAAAQNLTEAASQIMRIMVEQLDFEFGQVWIVDRAAGVLRSTDHYLRGIVDSGEFERLSRGGFLEPGRDLPGLIWQTKEPLCVADLAAVAAYRESPYVTKLKLTSAAGFAIFWRGEVWGVIVLFSRNQREMDEMIMRELGDINAQIAQFMERDHAKSAMQESEARLRAIVETAAEGIITVDENGIIESVNTAVQGLFGYAPAEAVGQDISQLIPVPLGRDRSEGSAPFEIRMQRLTQANPEGLGRHKSGRTLPILVAVNQVPLGHKKLFAAIVHDISALKEVEARAIQSERLAVIGELSAGLAHESRNALQRSQSCLEMLMMEIRDRPKAQELVDRIQRAQDYLLQLYEGVRNYAAPIHLERTHIDLADLARRIWDDLEARRERLSAKLVFVHEAADAHCYADPVRIGQVFRNLFENSLAACGDRCEIALSFADAHFDSRLALVIAVQDNGPGIPQEQQERIFQPFFTTKTRGSGLGLAISKRIIETHGGTIRVDPAVQHGARVEIILPRARTQE